MRHTISLLALITIHLMSPTASVIAPQTLPTALHGGTGGKQVGSSWSTYPVTAILTWDKADSDFWMDAVTHLSFTHSDGTISPEIGRYTGEPCGSVTLNANEYINAYQIWTAQPHGNCNASNIYVFGFAFRTNEGRELQCGGGDGGCGEQSTTGWVTYEGYFMGGVNWRGGNILDAIGFCFVREDLIGAEGLSCDPPPSCDEIGLAFSEPQTCQCQDACGDSGEDPFCYSLEKVATKLEEELFQYQVCPDPEETCCCSSDDCTYRPTISPTTATLVPSASPTSQSISPTLESISPTFFTSQPTQTPVIAPTATPTKSPSESRSNQPIQAPTNGPTEETTVFTTTVSDAPTQVPSSEKVTTTVDSNGGDESNTKSGARVDNIVVFAGAAILLFLVILLIVIYCVYNRKKNKQRESVPDHDANDVDDKYFLL